MGKCRSLFLALPQFDLLEAPPIKQLAEDEATASLHQLLIIVINGDVKVSTPYVPACCPLADVSPPQLSCTAGRAVLQLAC